MISSLGESMWARFALYAFLVAAAVAMLLPLSFASAATSIGNNVSVGGTLSVTGLSTFVAGFISSASSTVASSLNVSGRLNVSSTMFIAGDILPEANNTRDIGVYGTAFNDVFSSGTIYVNNIDGLVAVGSSTLTGLTNFTGGFISLASSTVRTSLNISGNLNASSTLFVGGNIRPGSNNGVDIGVNGLAWRDIYASSSVNVGNGTNSSTLIGNYLSIGSSASTSLVQSGSLLVGVGAGFNRGVFVVDATGGAGVLGGSVSASGTLSVSGLSTLTGLHSNASSTFQSSLNITGRLNVSSTHFVGGNIIPGANNTYDLGAQGNALANVFVSSSLTIGGNGGTVSATPITGHLSFLTSAIDLAATASSTDCTSSSVTVSGAAMGDTMLVSPLTFDNAFNAGRLSVVPTSANTVSLMYCAGGGIADDRDPGSILYRIDVWKH